MLTLPWIPRHTEGSALAESVYVNRFFCAAFITLSRKWSFAGTLIAACLWSPVGVGFLPSLGDPLPCWKLPRAAVCRTPHSLFPFKMCPPQCLSLSLQLELRNGKGFFFYPERAEGHQTPLDQSSTFSFCPRCVINPCGLNPDSKLAYREQRALLRHTLNLSPLIITDLRAWYFTVISTWDD